MADSKKPTKKTEAPKVKTVEDLRAELATKITELTDSKRGHRLGELTNPHILTVTRKQIARLHTTIRELEIKAKKGEK